MAFSFTRITFPKVPLPSSFRYTQTHSWSEGSGQAPGSGGSMVSAGGPTVVRGPRGRGHRGQPRGRAQVGPEGSRARGRSQGCAPRLGALGFGGTVGATAPGPSRTWRPSLTPVRGAGRGRAPRAGPGLTTRCLGLASATSISSAPEFSPGEPDRKSIISSSCLLSPSATVWMAVVHSSLQGSQSAEAPAPPRPGASPSEAPGLGARGLVSSTYTAPQGSPRGTCAR